jgi:hypothetical protein
MVAWPFCVDERGSLVVMADEALLVIGAPHIVSAGHAAFFIRDRPIIARMKPGRTGTARLCIG